MAYIGNIPAEAYISLSSQTFTTINGTVYTLSTTVANSDDLALFLNNVRQKPSTYTATDTTLTMGTATTTADELYCVFLGKGIQTVRPPAGSVGTSQIADLAVTTAKLDNLAVTNAKVADDAVGLDELSATGTPSASNYLRGDNSWSSIAADTNDKVGVSADDTTPGYLNGKLVAGANISLTEGSGGGDETLTAAFTGNLNTSVLNAGTVATARLGSGTADATTFLRGDQTYAAAGGGLTVADQWRLTTTFTGSINPIASNLERIDTTAGGQVPLGSAMTVASGIFTFPSTGYYLVQYNLLQQSTDGVVRGYGGGAIFATIDNSSYVTVAQTFGATPAISGTSRMSNSCSSIVDVTDTSNVKVKFSTEFQDSGMGTMGSTESNSTFMTFLRLADT